MESLQLPPIQETITELDTVIVSLTLYLKSGCWQVQPPTYEFNVMAFGLRNPSGSFQKFMTSILVGYIHKHCKVYLDDAIVYSNTLAKHEGYLERVLERFRAHGLWCNLPKCSFVRYELHYLVHIITSEENKPQQKYIQRVLEFRLPGSLNRYERFLPTSWLR